MSDVGALLDAEHGAVEGIITRSSGDGGQVTYHATHLSCADLAIGAAPRLDPDGVDMQAETVNAALECSGSRDGREGCADAVSCGLGPRGYSGVLLGRAHHNNWAIHLNGEAPPTTLRGAARQSSRIVSVAQ